jgi:hypothetical protein
MNPERSYAQAATVWLLTQQAPPPRREQRQLSQPELQIGVAPPKKGNLSAILPAAKENALRSERFNQMTAPIYFEHCHAAW